ncbi:MAG: peptidoglycan DD-metalloendopeptidase family protein [Pseudomonadota bacterium]|nr:peptidoglycan DD-metalloendopeptidase family protein [Pseudomonadota bacterium]
MTAGRRLGIAAVLAWLGAGLAGCFGPARLAPVEEAGRPGQDSTYMVVRGDTLYEIAWRYGLDYRQIAAWNRLANPDLIFPGQQLRLTPPQGGPAPQLLASAAPLPKASAKGRKQQARSPAPATAPRLAAVTAAKPAPAPAVSSAPAARPPGNTPWRWPVDGKVVRGFRPDLPGHKGIHISGSLGAAVRAASPGRVVYSGDGLPGYGRLIILKHSDTLLSAYGYLGKILVKEGDSIEVGQSIAEMGSSYNNSPVLHFEIRQNGKPIDPLLFLPG